MADCTIRILSGPGAGREFICAAAQTVIGRSPRCLVKLDAPSVSFEHAMMLREGDTFFIENLSASGTLVNRERVSGRVRLRLKDQIQLGPETLLRVQALPAAGGGGSSSRTWLLAVVVLMLVILLVVVAMDPLSTSSSVDWTRTYTGLQEFVQQESGAGRLPTEAPVLMREAWRLKQAGDRPAANAAWLKLQVLLEQTFSQTDPHALDNLSKTYPGALSHLTKPGAPVSDPDEMREALLQFITRMERAGT